MYESMYKILLLDQHLPGPIRLVLLVIGWLVGWQCSFLRNGSKDFSDFLHQVRGLYRWKIDRAEFMKKSYWFGDICKKVSKLAQNQTLIFFSKVALTIFFGFWPEVSTKYDLQFERNLLLNSTKLKKMEGNISGLERF